MTIVIEVVHIDLDVFQPQKASLESQFNIVGTSFAAMCISTTWASQILFHFWPCVHVCLVHVLRIH